eukprot:CAMPEP_0171445810 /NCGR_PEP_ID=MMETSP0881-20121228/36891_1 /TAXON_ID=67004 /ORGANISM="Thalassiosira weissflogii, Strain CCMP1336" /LENGTH=37 /DNA_ID= /DNA_START= /DNA_END= /DNA_ORIENTATION=
MAESDEVAGGATMAGSLSGFFHGTKIVDVAVAKRRLE